MANTTVLKFANEPRAALAKNAAQFVNATALYALSRPMTSGAVARATTAAKVKTVATITATVNGAFITDVAATDNFWTLSGTTVAVSSYQKYALLIDSAGAASIQEATQSTVSAAAVTWTNVSNLSSWAPFLTMCADTKFVAAVLTIATDATHTFVPGTTALNATGITATFINGIDPSLLPLIANETNALIGLGG